MIGYLRGRVVERGDELLILDVNGVGYELSCSSSTLMDIAGVPADDVQVWVQTQMREDALTLFGFSTATEKKMFNSLLKVNGVGPKMAIKILSGAGIEQLSAMIESGDVKGLSNLPKVGRKTAEQLILSLKGKLVLVAEPVGSGKRKSSPQEKPQSRFSGARADVLSALVNLGFRLPDAEKVVGDLPDDVELENGLRRGLQALTGAI